MRWVAWALLAPALALAPVAIVLGTAGHSRLDLPAGRGSELLVELAGAVAAVTFGVVGLLVARARPQNAIGWIFLGSALTLAVMAAAYGYADLALYGGQDWEGAAWTGWLASWLLIVPVFVGPCLVAQLFPDGRPLSPRWRPVLRLSVAAGAYVALAPALDSGRLGSYPTVENPAALPEPAARLIVDATWGVAILGLFSVSLVSIMLRFRRSRDTERQQLKWLALAGGVVIVAFAVSMWAQAAPAPWPTVVGLIAFCSFASMPVAVAVAILRYRLYELDRIVSKTLVYGALTVILGAGYAGLVLAGQWASSSFAGGSSLAIAVSTLAVAALVLPLRRRLQRVVDRRFYRRRYDAQRTLEAFGTRLREQVELDALAGELRAVVADTMEPAHVSLWRREQSAS